MQTRFLRDLPHSVTGLRCRLMFMEFKAGQMILDAVVSSGSDQPGSLVTVVAQVPTRPWGFAAKATLERWVEESREIELRLRRRRARRTQVEAASEDASMLLDLAA